MFVQKTEITQEIKQNLSIIDCQPLSLGGLLSPVSAWRSSYVLLWADQVKDAQG